MTSPFKVTAIEMRSRGTFVPPEHRPSDVVLNWDLSCDGCRAIILRRCLLPELDKLCPACSSDAIRVVAAYHEQDPSRT